MSGDAKELRVRGIALAKAGHRDDARQLLQQSVRIEPDNEAAWLWLASVARDMQERVFCLERLLQINPDHPTARKALARLTGQPETTPTIRPIGGLTLPQTPPPPPPEPTAAAPSVPLPDAEAVTEAQQAAEDVVRAFTAAQQHYGDIRWLHKTRNRAGERDVYVLRAQIAAVVVTVLALLGIGGTLFVLNNEDARAVLFAPTPTMTFTPTMTPTSTPGLTPTPSPTPRLTLTPSPTLPAALPTYNPYAPPRPTDIYPRVDSQVLRNAISLINMGQLETALPTISAERAAVGELFNAAPYYYEALALLEAGNEAGALRTLEEAEERLTASNTSQQGPVIDAGYARVYLRMASEATARGQAARYDEYQLLAREKAEAAIRGDRLNVEPYLTLADLHRIEGAYGEALDVIDEALAVPELSANTRLLVVRGELSFLQGDYDNAIYQAHVALTINVATEAAHRLRVRAALADDRPGLAATYAQAYLFYYPGSTWAWSLLGNARAAEGNREAAVQAYSQALFVHGDPDAMVDALTGRAAVYTHQGRYEDALTDLSRAYALTDDPAQRRARMETAYRAGRTATALEDVEALRNAADEPDPALDLFYARLLVDTASDDEAVLQRALGLLPPVSELDAAAAAVVHETTARVQLALENGTAAQNAINAALALAPTAERHYLRGQILELQGETNRAARTYEWLLGWSQVLPLDLRLDVEERLTALTT